MALFVLKRSRTSCAEQLFLRYRIGATIQIVLVLSILIYAYRDTMPRAQGPRKRPERRASGRISHLKRRFFPGKTRIFDAFSCIFGRRNWRFRRSCEPPRPAIYVILLALVNDVTMLPVASDNASPSALPEIPSPPSFRPPKRNLSGHFEAFPGPFPPFPSIS